MPKATKIVIEFDDGTRFDIDPAKVASIFTSEAAARKCGHNPPYGSPPQSGSGSTEVGTVSEVNTTTSTATTTGKTCYLVNGIIYCP